MTTSLQKTTERYLVGICLLRGSAGAVDPTWIADARLRSVVQAMRSLEDSGQEPDLSPISRLSRVPLSELAALSASVPTATNAEHWEQEARRLYRAGSMRAALADLLTKSKTEEISDQDIADFAERFTGDDETDPGPVPMRKILAEMVESLRSPRAAGISSGFDEIDTKIGMLAPGQLWVVAARPGMGKSALATDVGRAVAREGHRVLFVNLEMGAELLGQRLGAAEGNVPTTRIRTRTLTDADYVKLGGGAERLGAMGFWVYDRPELNKILHHARRLHSKHPLALVVVDYLQLITSRGYSRENEVATISRSLKAMALQLQVPVVALSQLNRSLESRPEKRPVLSDLRESGAIEQDADCVLFVYRDGYYSGPADGPRPKREDAEIICAKNRTGPTGTIMLDWYGETQTFRDQRKISYTYGAA